MKPVPLSTCNSAKSGACPCQRVRPPSWYSRMARYFAAPRSARTRLPVGEVVFNTAMTGYQEILTDPSYCRQIVTLTYPHIGNTGVNAEDVEATQRLCGGPRHSRPAAARSRTGAQSWTSADYLQRESVVGDRRHRHAQAHAHPAREGRAERLHHGRRHRRGDRRSRSRARVSRASSGMDLAKVVSCSKPYQWTESELDARQRLRPAGRDGRFHVVAYDYGIKRNILRMLADRGCEVTVVPAQTPAARSARD